jgi:hypothetical protein
MGPGQPGLTLGYGCCAFGGFLFSPYTYATATTIATIAMIAAPSHLLTSSIAFLRISQAVFISSPFLPYSLF